MNVLCSQLFVCPSETVATHRSSVGKTRCQLILSPNCSGLVRTLLTDMESSFTPRFSFLAYSPLGRGICLCANRCIYPVMLPASASALSTIHACVIFWPPGSSSISFLFSSFHLWSGGAVGRGGFVWSPCPLLECFAILCPMHCFIAIITL